MKRSIIDSFNYAVSGIILSLKTERNMLIHYIIAILVLGLSLFFDFTRVEFLLLLFAISLVLTLEMINTAIEKTVDMVTKEYHPYARIAKDISAGAVLIASVNALIVGYLLFFDRLSAFSEGMIFKIKKSPVHLTFIALLLVVLLTIGLKAKYYRGRGTHFQGGTVSGHSAVAFCVAAIISFLVENILVISLAFGLALLVAESRVEGKIHTLIEVVLGGVLGIIVAILAFQIIG
ncbi:MAG: diacylglycerol kinase [Tissierellaceae bacterium]|jgi:diacylglycerol kinase (ATP)|nr:phosphatase PAP2 family protein [Tissierellia bacterium]